MSVQVHSKSHNQYCRILFFLTNNSQASCINSESCWNVEMNTNVKESIGYHQSQQVLEADVNCVGDSCGWMDGWMDG